MGFHAERYTLSGMNSQDASESQACRLPTSPDSTEEGVIRRVLASRRIAVVGLSDDPSRPSFDVARYLLAAGYDIVPVNPTRDFILGRRSYPSLADVPGPIEVVNVFRRPEHCAEVVHQAIAAGAKAVWLQQGIINDEAAQLARQVGIDFVQDRCLKVEHIRRV